MILLITNKFLTCNLIDVFEVHRLRIELLELVQPEPVGLLYSGGQRPQEVFGGHENLKQKKNISQRFNKICFSFFYDAFSCSEIRTEYWNLTTRKTNSVSNRFSLHKQILESFFMILQFGKCFLEFLIIRSCMFFLFSYFLKLTR